MNTKEWFQVCKPNPTPEQACVQVGVHLEEVAEMLESLGWNSTSEVINALGNSYKRKSEQAMQSLLVVDKVELLDSILDQVVTGQGVCHTLGMDYDGGMKEVESSNASKLEDGKPVFDSDGKITKGKHYKPPQLTNFIK